MIGVLRKVAGGDRALVVFRRHGVTEQNFYRWKQKFGDLQVPEARRLKTLEEENRQLKRLVVDQALNLQVVSTCWGKSGDARAAAGGRHQCNGLRRHF